MKKLMQEKRKAGIITIIDLTNYGNRLQNYAVNEVLKKRKIMPQTLHIISCTSRDYLRCLLKLWMKKLPLIYTFILKMKGRKSIEKKRFICFDAFTKKYLPTKTILVTKDSDIKKKCKSYDYYVIGSDQIWNPEYSYARGMDFASFAEPYKKICFSPSFGVSQIKQEYCEKVAEGLKEIPYISVRERSGAKIVKDLVGRDAEILIDPTMMLDADEWRKIASKPNVNLEKKYVLCYFLGKRTKEQSERIDELKERYRLEEYTLLDKGMPELYVATPDEFISLIEHAELICTDSFHASVFSILFEKPFIVFERDGDGAGMSSRLDTLLDTFHLVSRKNRNILIEKVLQCDYTECNKVLEEEREKVNRFLDISLNNRNY